MCTTLPDLSYNYSSPLGLHPQRYYHDPPSIQLNRKRNPSAKNTFGTFFTLGTVMCLGVLFGWFWSVDVRSFYRCNGGWEMGIQKCFADVYYNMLQDPHWPVHFKVSRKKRKRLFRKQMAGFLWHKPLFLYRGLSKQTLLPEIILKDLRINYVQNYKC